MHLLQVVLAGLHLHLSEGPRSLVPPPGELRLVRIHGYTRTAVTMLRTCAGTGWSHNAFAASAHHRPHTSRPVTVRLLVIQACKFLDTLHPRARHPIHHEVNHVLSQVEQRRPPTEPAISLDEMLEICDTEGSSQNGGGSFTIKHEAGHQFVKFEPDTNSAVGGHRGSLVPGDIGSPVPANSTPAVFGGFGAPASSVLRQYSSSGAGLFGGSS
jgi:hypothetical protein